MSGPRDWKTVLEADPFKTAEYSYTENVDAREQPRIEGIPGDIHEINVYKKDGKYCISLTVFMDDLEGLSEEAVNFLEARNPELYNEYQERAQEMSEELEARKPQSR